MPDYDVIVVGAGPAGSSAAYFLGNYEISTLLLVPILRKDVVPGAD